MGKINRAASPHLKRTRHDAKRPDLPAAPARAGIAALAGVVCLAIACAMLASSPPVDDLEKKFLNPPDSAKPRVLWMWMGSNVSKDGISRDLEALKAAGFGGATMFSLADTTTPWPGPIGKSPTPEIIAFSEPWWKLVRYAAEEARGLGLDFGMANGPGYESSGGPWVTPEFSMQEICWSQKPVYGPGTFRGALARPEVDAHANMPFPVFNPETGKIEKPAIDARRTYYRDIAVLAVPAEGVVAEGQVLDLSSKMRAGGELVWDAPAGVWTVYRFGHTTTGALCQPAEWKATGLECDKMNVEAVSFHLKHVLGELKSHLGDLIGTGFTHLHFDSYEAGTPTWTPWMREEFKARRGYDVTPWLPALAGRLVVSNARTEKFRADFERTIQDLYRDVYFATAAQMIREAGLKFMCEPYGGPWRVDEVVPSVDRVMTEFWTGGGSFNAAELEPMFQGMRRGGQTLLEAEAFTGSPEFSQWKETPAWLKPVGDAAFLAGINSLSLHRFVHQPWEDRWRPGNAMGQWGTHFDRTQTWWEPGKAWVKYLQRCQAMLQAGRVAAEALNDFAVEDVRGGVTLKSRHRISGQADLYFVVNLAQDGGSARCVFSVAGRQPELWDPVWGTVRDLDEFQTKDGRTVVPLSFAPGQSFFIVFRKLPEEKKARVKNSPEVKTVVELEGPWAVAFDPKWGGPEKPVSFGKLEDWTGREEPGVKYYSGTASYRKAFDLLAVNAPGKPVFEVDLGVVNHLAHVTINGKDLGVVWCAPWRVTVPAGLLKAKENQLIIEVTNVWANRLIGDEQEPPDCIWSPGHQGFGGFLQEFPDWFLKGKPRPSRGRRTFTTWNYFSKTSPLVPSGLLGPVRIAQEE